MIDTSTLDIIHIDAQSTFAKFFKFAQHKSA